MAARGGTIAGVIIVNDVFSFRQEYRAEKATHALQKLLPHGRISVSCRLFQSDSDRG
jgi:magnesium-transporting ATPase (P-type)